MFLSKGFRLSALLATLVMAFSLVAVDTAEARRGGSFGSRGVRTQQAVPATPASPKATAPVERTMNDRTTTQQTGAAGAATAAARPSLFGGLGGALLGGMLFSGLFGMMFGYGFGGMGGILALLVQVLIIGLIAAFFLRRRQARPAMAGGAPYGNANTGANPNGDRMAYQGANLGGGSASAANRSGASRRAGRRDEVGITDTDLGTFETRLKDLQTAFASENYDGLRQVATPEVVGYLAEELGQNATNGVRNEVFDVQLLEGDVAEAWREGDTDFATVSMRYESRDVMRDRTTGEIVSGNDSLSETTEIWTFKRVRGGQWLVSAIQDA